MTHFKKKKVIELRSLKKADIIIADSLMKQSSKINKFKIENVLFTNNLLTHYFSNNAIRTF